MGKVLKRQIVVERKEGEMCKLMKCRIILAWGKYTAICAVCVRVVVCVYEWVESDQNSTLQNLLSLHSLCMHFKCACVCVCL